MEHKYQWSAFFDDTRREQVVVRCDDWKEFLEALSLAKSLITGQVDSYIVEPEPEVAKDQCAIHNRQMKLRTGKNGAEWYDHRWKIGEEWYLCNGKDSKKQNGH